MKQTPFSLWEHLERETAGFGVGRFHYMKTDWNLLQGLDHLIKRHDTAVAAWAKTWTQWGGRSTLRCRCVGKESDLPFVRCRKDMENEPLLADLLASMHEKGEVIA